MSIAMRHPDIFGRAGSHSGIYTESNAPPAFNPLELASNASFLGASELKMYLDNGANDRAAENGQRLISSRLSTRGIPHTYLIHPAGAHDEEYWQAHVSEYLDFYARDWPRSTADLPSCAAPSP
jgi:S-formylglutathione hydrolase FrmB